ncbi:hypothetical protein GCM10023195_74860 [Actinoallomurus liliacearum]|uniref:NACHT domain-containing protein n=1 Tax=Actinoallomurus liliacearum TaxID=1080073 RepID=A0ABP8TYA1_9ACTN
MAKRWLPREGRRWAGAAFIAVGLVALGWGGWSVLRVAAGRSKHAVDVSNVAGMVIAALALVLSCWQYLEQTRLRTDPEALDRAERELAAKVAEAERRLRLDLLGPENATADLEFVPDLISFRDLDGPSSGTLGTVGDFYRGSTGRLLITGSAGAGKTVLTVELIRHLLRAGRKGGRTGVPVRIGLAGWDPPEKGRDEEEFEGWLAARVARTYGMNRRVVAALLRDRRVLPVLDGLDEMDLEAREPGAGGVPRRAIRALHLLNRYVGDDGPAPLILTCRTSAYEALRTGEAVLRGATTVVIRPLSTEEIDAYLTRRLADRGPGEEAAWVQLRMELAARPQDTLARTLSTPWRLTLAASVLLAGRDPSELLTVAEQGDVDSYLLAHFVATAIEGRGRRRYRVDQVTRWLAHLAKHLNEQSERGASGTTIARRRLILSAGEYFGVIAAGVFMLALPILGVWAVATLPGGISGTFSGLGPAGVDEVKSRLVFNICIGVIIFAGCVLTWWKWLRNFMQRRTAALRGDLPWRFAIFLAWAHEIGLLCASGDAYQFRHLELQQWLASREIGTGISGLHEAAT